jgi:hypothetical protein
MNLERKPTEFRLQFARRSFGPDRAEITKRSNNVSPNVDDAIHGLSIIAPASSEATLTASELVVNPLRASAPLADKAGKVVPSDAPAIGAVL